MSLKPHSSASLPAIFSRSLQIVLSQSTLARCGEGVQRSPCGPPGGGLGPPVVLDDFWGSRFRVSEGGRHDPVHEQVETLDHEAPSRQPIRKLNEMKPQSPFTGRPGVGDHDAGDPFGMPPARSRPIGPPQSKEERDVLPVEVVHQHREASGMGGGTVHRGPRCADRPNSRWSSHAAEPVPVHRDEMAELEGPDRVLVHRIGA